MAGYLASFSIYTLAMIGIIFAALFIFKGALSGNSFSKKSSFLSIEDTMSLSPRKTLYVIKAGSQRFLIAGDIDKTSLIAKLDEEGQQNITEAIRQDKSLELSSMDGIESLDEFASIINFKKDNNILPHEKRKKGPMMRELARKLQF